MLVILVFEFGESIMRQCRCLTMEIFIVIRYGQADIMKILRYYENFSSILYNTNRTIESFVNVNLYAFIGEKSVTLFPNVNEFN